MIHTQAVHTSSTRTNDVNHTVPLKTMSRDEPLHRINEPVTKGNSCAADKNCKKEMLPWLIPPRTQPERRQLTGRLEPRPKRGTALKADTGLRQAIANQTGHKITED
jgi:hypothetical protein